jgi:uncharacterized protein YcbX
MADAIPTPEHDADAPDPPGTGPHVAELSVAVVKGTRLTHPPRVFLDAHGVRDDRRFHVVSQHQMQHGATRAPLTQVETAWDRDSGRLTLRFPAGEVADGIVELGEPVDGYPAWDRSRVRAGREVLGPWSAAISRALDQPLRLVEVTDPGRAVDVAAVTLVGRASAQQLAAELGDGVALGTRRFRMNLTLDGIAAYEEDAWYGRTLALGDCRLRIVGAVPRCVVVTRDPDSGDRDHDALRAIVRSRPPIPAPDGDGVVKAPFGVYADVVEPGWVAAGDRVEFAD